MAEVLDLPHVAARDLEEMLPPASTALVVVDIQNDFAAAEGLVGRFGVDLDPIEAVIDRIEAMIAAARKVGVTIAFMRVVTRPETDSTALKTLMARRGSGGGEAICRAGQPGADYYRLFPESGDIEIEKLLFDSFHGTDLDDQLKARKIDTVVMTGITTECCVDSTARGAFHRGYNVFVVSDACAAYEPGLHTGSLLALQKNLALLTTAQDVMEAWS
ncbi:cysteine hydrolase family protein [Novosphingobium pentaromativorans]|uniref:Isochorismatase hydrolase n=1 Tax=Novosphingobium pentaromativorans US6-1 TaxID=1088721 RepID=G6EEE2_9SPHN|nr:cysteine hydrolase [Novosphingobium pentaromativorans]AIT79465.1 isochorismatase [Novosphingobium pentaromativorans US6-1]EHJ60365.1 isochorismatase hydrolase [Novosphingobium pentaromativorans US6-1]